MAGWTEEREFRAVQNYATNHVVVQPTGADFNEPGQMAAALKLFPFTSWPSGEVGTPDGHPHRASPVYHMSGGL